MSDAYENFQEGRRRLKDGMPAQATVSLEKAKRLEPAKASIREALGIAYFRLRRWEEAEAEFRAVLELVADRRLRPLRARPRAREAGPPGRGERPLQARELDGPRSRHYAARIRELDDERLRAVVQRVARARVTPGGEIGAGLCVLLGVAATDDEALAERLAGRVARLRIFEGDDGKLRPLASSTRAAPRSSSRSSR